MYFKYSNHNKSNNSGTSEDSEGKDSSFESVNEEAEKYRENLMTKSKSVPSLEELKSRQEKFNELIRRTKQKGKEEGKRISWSTLYYTFFNNFYKKNFVTLNEIDLRCKFLLRADQQEKITPRTKSDQKDFYKSKPLTNLNEFINYFSDKKFSGIEKKNVGGYTKNWCNKKEKYLINSQMKEKNNDSNLNNISFDRGRVNNNGGGGGGNGLKDGVKRKKFGEDADEDIWLRVNGIKEKIEKVKNILKEGRKGKFNKTRNNEVLFGGKKIYEQELEKFSKNLRRDDNISNRVYDEYLDFKSNENFLNDNIGIDLVAKYGNKLEEQEKFGNHLNSFYNKILHNIDPLEKLDV